MKTCFALVALLLPSLSYAQERTDLTVRPQALFTLTLPAQFSTGASWMVKTLPQTAVLVGMERQPGRDCHGAVGCPEQEVLYLKAVKRGTDKLVLVYGRPFEALPKEETVKTITVR
ncbi:protease inhibitor I42 family protein [Saccharibacter floricola]|uniref:Proteinase inhibitor I42 chagasin domain-containing protein n=1 Tax=Saccharibacter floricola DSM 15669 TaxID=1123227 RepID=A0ABQ0NZ96_9PROT|nr:protease inhibitor I42 family protein [Saccharibacter floricola]GBQ07218.1 hypothetical protein AA15669_1285 [Saccharibacter floricola DSM 15669]